MKFRKNWTILSLFLLLLILGTAADVFFWKHITKENTHENKKWQAQLQQLTTQIQQQQNVLTTFQTQLTQLIRDEHTNRAEDVLSETAYLVDLANLYLQSYHNIPNAIKTLSLAEQHLRDLKNPEMTPLEQALASDINQLNEMPMVDQANVLLQLQLVGESIGRLPLMPTHFTAPTENETPTTAHWWSALLDSIKNLFVIQYHSSESANLLPPEQREYIRQNLIFSLRQAEWAVLQEQSELYQRSLNDIKNLLSTYYVKGLARDKVIEKLDGLSQLNIQPKIPPLTRSLQALAEIKNNPNPSSTTKEEGKPLPPADGIEM